MKHENQWLSAQLMWRRSGEELSKWRYHRRNGVEGVAAVA
jgi:hypothetical protein